jgi:hypothetical protein
MVAALADVIAQLGPLVMMPLAPFFWFDIATLQN